MANVSIDRLGFFGEDMKAPLGLLRMKRKLELSTRILIDHAPDLLPFAFDETEVSRATLKDGVAPFFPSSARDSDVFLILELLEKVSSDVAEGETHWQDSLKSLGKISRMQTRILGCIDQLRTVLRSPTTLLAESSRAILAAIQFPLGHIRAAFATTEAGALFSAFKNRAQVVLVIAGEIQWLVFEFFGADDVVLMNSNDTWNIDLHGVGVVSLRVLGFVRFRVVTSFE